MKSDGTQVAAVWRETMFWDRDTGQPLEADGITATLTFDKPCKSIKVTSFPVFRANRDFDWWCGFGGDRRSRPIGRVR